MVLNRFQSEPDIAVARPHSRLEHTQSASDQTLATALESVLFGILIRKSLSKHEIESLDLHFFEPNRLMIVFDNKCLYPDSDNKDECSLCAVIKDNQINLCDLMSRHTELVDRIEDSWPSILDASSKVNLTFENSASTILVNRSSGRVIAINKGLTALSGISESEIIGKEYGTISKRISNAISGKKISIENFTAGSLHLSLVIIGGVKSGLYSDGSLHTESAQGTHKLIEEPDTIGLHFNRFNALLQKNIVNQLAPEMVAQLEDVVAELAGTLQLVDHLEDKACLRLLVQSILMAHSTIAGHLSQTEIAIEKTKTNTLKLEFKTQLISKAPPNPDNEWFQIALKLADKIGLRLGQIQIRKKQVITQIQIAQKEPITA